MAKARYLAFIYQVLFFFLFACGCSGHGKSDVDFREKSIASFNVGREVEAVSLAKKINDADQSSFLLAQYIIYDTIANNYNFNLINKRWYEQIINLDLSNITPSLRGKYISSQAFSGIYLDSISSGLKILSSRCKAWVDSDVSVCFNNIINATRASYISKPSRMDALYLFEAAQVGDKLKLIDSTSYHYNMGLAFAIINRRISIVMLHNLINSNLVDDNMVKVYCSIGEQGSAKQAKQGSVCTDLAPEFRTPL